MVFSSAIFLFLFLPAVLGLYVIVPRSARNTVLLIASLLFYAWGEQEFVIVMLATILVNYVFGLLLDRSHGQPRARIIVGLAVGINLAFLIAFKYANFLVDNLNPVMAELGARPFHLDPIHLPIGISFFTFQAMSYVVDVYRGDVPVQRDLLRFALYKSLFPQLIAGPIVRYRDVAADIARRNLSLADFAEGTRRFIIGLGKKTLIANTLAVPADAIFAIPPTELDAGSAWLGIVSYSFQLYFDFSGYSDMAIGLGRMFGFHFRENFIHPYAARTITEFWRRWHISLSTWFRDYLYIPLGGNRVSAGRTYFNLIVVFLLCGLWHGAQWTFVVWGAYHGVLLVAERLGLRRWLEATKLRRAGGHVYAGVAIMVGWVFFRADSMGHAVAFLGAMSGGGGGEPGSSPAAVHPDAQVWVALVVGLLASLPLFPGRWTPGPAEAGGGRRAWLPDHAREFVRVALYLFVLALAVLSLASGTHNPFIYFRF